MRSLPAGSQRTNFRVSSLISSVHQMLQPRISTSQRSPTENRRNYIFFFLKIIYFTMIKTQAIKLFFRYLSRCHRSSCFCDLAAGRNISVLPGKLIPTHGPTPLIEPGPQTTASTRQLSKISYFLEIVKCGEKFLLLVNEQVCSHTPRQTLPGKSLKMLI